MKRIKLSKSRYVARHRKKEPSVGIFWVISGKLVIDSTPLIQAEPYGVHLTHPGSHLEVWTMFQQKGTAPNELEYEEPPRGRVVCNRKTQRFTILADRCILKDNRIVSKIMSEMKLPNEKTDKGTDSHYRCSACLRGNAHWSGVWRVVSRFNALRMAAVREVMLYEKAKFSSSATSIPVTNSAAGLRVFAGGTGSLLCLPRFDN